MAADYLRRLQEEGKSFYQNMTPLQRGLLLTMGFLGVTLAIIGGIYLQQPNMSLLYNELSGQDASKIVSYLKEQNIPYKINENYSGNNSIEVPKDRVHELRMQMAGQNLPREGGVEGFNELFNPNSSNLGMTNRVFDLNYQRAIAGELSRTIMDINAVDRARVHLAIPKKQIFSELDEQASASVTLKMKPLQSLSKDKVKAIANLVANAVPGLSPKSVSIVDTEANLLYGPTMNDEDAQKVSLNNEQLKLQQATEKDIRQKVLQILSRVVGAQHVNVQVDATLNFDQEESISKNFTPNDNPNLDENTKAVRSEKEVVEEGQGLDQSVEGVPGTSSNVPGNPGYRNESTEANANYKRTDRTKNYEVPEIQTTHIKDPGKVERISLSVAVDSQSPAINAPEGLDSNDPLVQNLRNLAVAAAGLNLKRGDSISIYALPFDNSDMQAQKEALLAAEKQDFWMQAMQWGVLGLVMLLIILGALFGLGRRRKPVEGEELDIPALKPEDQFQALEAPSQYAEAAFRRAQAVDSLSDMAKDNPAHMARLLRVWMQEDS